MFRRIDGGQVSVTTRDLDIGPMAVLQFDVCVCVCVCMCVCVRVCVCVCVSWAHCPWIGL